MQARCPQNLGEDEACWPITVGRARMAESALQAMQAMNQLLALQINNPASDRSGSDHARPGGGNRWELAQQAAATDARHANYGISRRRARRTPGVNFYGN